MTCQWLGVWYIDCNRSKRYTATTCTDILTFPHSCENENFVWRFESDALWSLCNTWHLVPLCCVREGSAEIYVLSALFLCAKCFQTPELAPYPVMATATQSQWPWLSLLRTRQPRMSGKRQAALASDHSECLSWAKYNGETNPKTSSNCDGIILTMFLWLCISLHRDFAWSSQIDCFPFFLCNHGKPLILQKMYSFDLLFGSSDYGQLTKSLQRRRICNAAASHRSSNTNYPPWSCPLRPAAGPEPRMSFSAALPRRNPRSSKIYQN